MKVQRWVVLGVLAAFLAAGSLPLASAEAWVIGNNTLYLAKHKNKDILSETAPKQKGARHVESTKIDPASAGFTNYRELGTWNTDPVAAATRIINLGEANLWLRVTDADTQQAANVGIKVEVLKNGNAVIVDDRRDCVALQKNAALMIIDLPAPFPAIDLAVGDVFGVRVSVRDGSAAPGCVGGVKAYKVRLDYDGTAAPSSLTSEAAGPTAAAGLIVIGQPSVIVENVLYVTPATVITIPISANTNLESCTITLTSLSVPPAFDPVIIGCTQGPNAFGLDGLPFGPYEIRAAVVVILDGGVRDVRSDLVDFTLVATLPTVP